MVESAPLLREYTLIAYRGFESLSLRQTKRAPQRGALLVWRREQGAEITRGSTNRASDLGRRRRPAGVKTRDVIAF